MVEVINFILLMWMVAVFLTGVVQFVQGRRSSLLTYVMMFVGLGGLLALSKWISPESEVRWAQAVMFGTLISFIIWFVSRKHQASV